MNTTTIDLHEVVARLTLLHKDLEYFAGTLVMLAEDCDSTTSGPVNLVARRLEALSEKILDVHNGLRKHLADQKMPRWRRLRSRFNPTTRPNLNDRQYRMEEHNEAMS